MPPKERPGSALTPTALQVQRWPRALQRAYPALSVVCFLALWEFLSARLASEAVLPSPGVVVGALADAVASGQMLTNIEVSLGRLILSFVLAVCIGAPIGLFMATSRFGRDFFEPIVDLVRPISGIAWIPFALYLIGISPALPIFIMTYVAVFPIILNTYSAACNVQGVLVRAARVLGLRRGMIVAKVYVPAALSGILTGARLGIGGAWLALVAAEFIGAPDGLGFSIWYFA